MTDDTEKRPEELEAEIEQTRARIGSTVDAIQSKLSPGQVVDQVMGYFRGSTAEYAANLGQTVRQNPVPVALVGVGLAWLMMSGSSDARPGTRFREGYFRPQEPRHRYPDESYKTDWSPDEEVRGPEPYLDYPYDPYREDIYMSESYSTGAAGDDYSGSETAERAGHRLRDTAASVRDKVGETAAQVRDKVSDTAASVRDKASETAAQVRDKVSDTAASVRDRASETAAQVRDRVSDTAEAARARLGETAQAARVRLEHARGSTAEYAANLGQTVRHNPVPIALVGLGVGVGLAWLMMSGSSGARPRAWLREGYAKFRQPRYTGEGHAAEWYPDEELRGPDPYLDYPYDPYREDVYASESYSAGAAEEDYSGPETLERARYRASYGPSGAATGLGDRGASDTAASVRDRMSETAAQVRDKVSDTAAGVRDTVSETAAQVRDQVSDTAEAARAKLSETAQAARAGVGQATDAVRTRTREAVEATRQGATRLGHQARYQAERLSQQARYQAERAQSGFTYLLEEQPLVLAGIGFALGAALGSALPKTHREDEWMGETRDELFTKAKEMGQEQYRKAQAVATAAVDSARQEIERQGLTPEGGKDVIRQVKDKVQQVAEAALDSVKQEADRQQLTPEGGQSAIKQVQEKVQHVAEAAWEGGKQEADRQGLTPPSS